MARKTQVVLIDDIDGSAADDTITFGIDGYIYEVDLSLEHEQELRSSIAKFVGPATPLGKWSLRSGARGSRPAARRTPVGANRERNAAIRSWAKQQGLKVSPRGRIPDNVVDEFEQAHAA